MLDEHDRTKLVESFKSWPERLKWYGHPETEPDFTIRIEQLGGATRSSIEKGYFDPASLRNFLVQVGYWKMPHDLASHQSNVNRNSESQIVDTFKSLASTLQDEGRIEACTRLHGFGDVTGQTRMASAILRFLWPEQYGVIDWRNWAVLSNCEFEFLSAPLLPAIAISRVDLRKALYDVQKFLTYLDVLRRLLTALNFKRVADVDLALYSYSAEVWKFPRQEELLWTKAESKTRPSIHPKTWLHEIYETFWPEWQRLETLPFDLQKRLKITFLWQCLDITPKNITVWDELTQMKLPYHIKHERDLKNLEQKMSGMSAKPAVDELNFFMYNMRLKGDGHGVI